MSGSETESDSSQSKIPRNVDVSEGAFSRWDARNSIWSNDQSLGSIEDVQVLLQLDVPLLIEKPEFMDDVLVSSARLLRFLIQSTATEVTDDFACLLSTFSALVHETCLRRLFEYRVFFREIALQLDGSQRRVDTWVDEFLARLCRCTEFYASGCCHYERPYLSNDSIRSQQNRILVQASSQLPENWHDMNIVLATQQYSPAAKRMAVTLLFAAYIMGPRLAPVSSLPATKPADLLDELFMAVKYKACDTQSSVLLQGSYEERITAAMLVSLVPLSDKTKSTSSSLKSSQLRPEGLEYLLDLINMVMLSENESQPFYIVEDLDVPQIILLLWGDVVPWSWSIWDDQRVANVEDIHSMTATWIYHIDRPIFGRLFNDEKEKNSHNLLNSILTDVTASSATIPLLLHRILDLLVDTTDDSHGLPGPALSNILGKLCWAFITLLENYTVKGNPSTLSVQLPEYAKYLLLIFCHLPSSSKTIPVKSLIVEGLALVPSDAIQLGLHYIANNKSSHFFRRLEQVINLCTDVAAFRSQSQMILQGSVGVNQESTEEIISLLNFLTILLLHDRLETKGLRDIIPSGFQKIMKFMKTKVPDITPLVDPFLTTAVVLHDYAGVACILDSEVETIWSWSIHTSGCKTIRAAIFSRFLLGIDRRVGDPLLHHEACELLVLSLASILDQRMTLEEEPLALLTCSSICEGLIWLICSVDNLTRERILSSPWVVNAGNTLSRIIEDSTSETSYYGQVNKKLENTGKRLIEAIFSTREFVSAGSDSQSPPETLFSKADVKLFYYRDSQYSGLLLVDEYSLD